MAFEYIRHYDGWTDLRGIVRVQRERRIGQLVSHDTAINTMLTFAPGEVSKAVSVEVYGDTTAEPDEAFFVNLTNPANATIAVAQGVGTILNDDEEPLPALSINNVSQNEGDSGTTNFTFAVTLSAASASVITVDVSTSTAKAALA